MPVFRLAFATVCAFLALAAAPANGAPMTVQIVNNSGVDPTQVWLSLYNGPSADGQLPNNTPVQLSSLTNSSFVIGNMAAGRLYVAYGSQGVDINTTTMTPIRNDKIEFTNPGVADLTAVDFFGIPMGLQTLDSGGNVLETLGFRCFTSTLAPALQALPGGQASTILTSANTFSKVLSPSLSDAYPLMTAYVQAMSGQTITVNSTFDGRPDAGLPAVTTNMTGTFQPDGSITLSGTFTNIATGAVTPNQTLAVAAGGIAPGIYSNNGSYTKNGAPGQVGDNDAFSTVYRDLVAGFAMGYWGGRYGNQTSAWLRQPPFAAAWTTPPPFTPYYHQYGAMITEYSSAYGFPFTDLSPTTVQAGLGSNVATMRVTIEPDTGPNVPGCAGSSTPTPPTPPPTSGGATPDPVTSTPVTPVPSTPATPISTPAPKRTTKGRAVAIVERRAVRLDRAGRLILPVRCDGDPCRGELEVYTRVRRGKKLVIVPVGATEVAVPEAKTQHLVVKLTKTGRELIRRAGRRGLPTTAVVRLGPRSKASIVSRRAVKVLPYAKPKRSRR